MAMSQFKSKKKVSGGMYKSSRKKKSRELASLPTFTKIGKRKVKKVKIRSGKNKFKLLRAEFVNVFDPKMKKYFRLKIDSIIDNPADRHFVKRGIITKGTIVKTEKGNARITSRSGQEGALNAVLVWLIFLERLLNQLEFPKGLYIS